MSFSRKKYVVHKISNFLVLFFFWGGVEIFTVHLKKIDFVFLLSIPLTTQIVIFWYGSSNQFSSCQKFVKNFFTNYHFLESIINRDPAARDKLSIILTYQGVKAVFFHHLAHQLWNLKLFLFARMLSQFSRFLTGIEIHPGAKIGKNLLIEIILIKC